MSLTRSVILTSNCHEPKLGDLFRSFEDPFTELAYKISKATPGLSGTELADLTLSAFAHRAANYDLFRGVATTDFTQHRHAIANALLRREPTDLLDPRYPNLATWLVVNSSPNSKHLDALLIAMLAREINVPLQGKDVFQDLVSNQVACHRSVGEPADLHLMARIRQMDSPHTYDLDQQTFLLLQDSLQSSGANISPLKQNDFKVEEFVANSCAEGDFLPVINFTLAEQSFQVAPCLESNFGGALTYQGIYRSLFSGFPLDDGKTFLVTQIQGVKAHPSIHSGNSVADFPDHQSIISIPSKITLMLAVEYARRHKFEQIAVVPGELNIWAQSYSNRAIHQGRVAPFPISVAKKIYDVSSRQLKFKLVDPEFGRLHTLSLN